MKLIQQEIEVLRILNGEDVPGWGWCSAMAICCDTLKEKGYAKGCSEITEKGKDFLTTLDK